MPSYAVVETPKINNPSETESDFSMRNKDREFFALKLELEGQKITPDKYPRVIDLGSGNGGVASFLIQMGWRSGDITCVDKFKSVAPVVQGVDWLYIDIDAMAFELSVEAGVRRGTISPDGDRLDSRLLDLQGKFDLITCNYLFLNDVQIGRLAEFLLRPGGIAVIDGVAKQREELMF